MIRLLRRHLLILILLLAGAGLRVLAVLAYRPAILYIDSFRYLYLSTNLEPDAIDPIGYPLILAHLLQDGQGNDVGTLTGVVEIQHVLGLAVAAAVYVLLVRMGLRPWLAALGVAPLLLDGYQVQIEEMIMSETWFVALLVAALWFLLGARGLSWWRALLAGGLVGLAMFVRIIGAVVIVPLACFALFAPLARPRPVERRPAVGGRRRLVWVPIRTLAALLAFGVVVLGYAANYKAVTGQWGLTTAQGNVLYGRAATIADCDTLPLSPTLRLFCPVERLGQREDVDYYANTVFSNDNWPAGLPYGADKNALARQFALTVFRHEPGRLAAAVLGDFVLNFSPFKITFGDGLPVERWQFQTSYPVDPPGDTQPTYWSQRFDHVDPGVRGGPARFLRAYQLGLGHTPGPALALAAVLGLAGGVPYRRRSRLPFDRLSLEHLPERLTHEVGDDLPRRLGQAGLLVTGSGLLLLLGAAGFEFSWRYQIPALTLLPIGGVLGLSALLDRWARGWSPGAGDSGAGRRPPLAEFPDTVDALALRQFDEDYPELVLAPLTVVIAAYHEADGIGPVLERMPSNCSGLDVSVLVVVDGSGDRTGQVVREHDVLVADVAANRGQGAALRLGYQLAVRHGAELIVTTDADGQYDIAELPELIAPILDDRADFVTGSRRLGLEEADSRVRWLGVRVFAALASVLTRTPITDTSFGFRAMRSELAVGVTLREPQYQASELLLGVLARRARVVEVPLSMRLRGAGASKKGGSLVYGANYARVMVGTWLREYVGGRRRSAGRTGRTSTRT